MDPRPMNESSLGHRLVNPQPDASCSELDEGEIVGVGLLVAGRDGTEVFDSCEEPLDPVSPPIDSAIERGRRGASWDRLDDGAGDP